MSWRASKILLRFFREEQAWASNNGAELEAGAGPEVVSVVDDPVGFSLDLA